MHDLALPSAGVPVGTADSCFFGLSLCSGAGGLTLEAGGDGKDQTGCTGTGGGQDDGLGIGQLNLGH